ncbi:hypothetical protein [Cysteiniphilum marinum]|uniref:hypothetical protein n=1 Tax=Cysteiniphilum marinum TaxID=2774191 RepID=UPI00193AB380|nr:hypothetical protein [Cysteiniphilum marinum]
MKTRNGIRLNLLSVVAAVVILVVIVVSYLSFNRSGDSKSKNAFNSNQNYLINGSQLPYSDVNVQVADNIRQQFKGRIASVEAQQTENIRQQNERIEAKLKALEEKAQLGNQSNGTQGSSDLVAQQIAELKQSFQKETARLKETQSELVRLKSAMNSTDGSVRLPIGDGQTTVGNLGSKGNSGNTGNNPNTGTMNWVGDVSVLSAQSSGQVSQINQQNNQKNRSNPLNGALDLFNDNSTKGGNSGNSGNAGSGANNQTVNASNRGETGVNSNKNGQGKESATIPAYTIPKPSVLSNVIPLNPIIGRSPKGDNHTVWSPFQVLFMVEDPNFTSNEHQLDDALPKMLGTATCVGDIGASASACYVNTLTYIFPDGTISTVTSDTNNGSGFKGLGFLADEHGSPQIHGEIKTSMGLRLAMSGVTAGVSAYGSGLAQSATQQNETSVGSIVQQITNANQYAMGQAINSTAQGVNDEWREVSKNLFDFVYTSNWDADTQRLKRFNVVITEEIAFDYNENGRKLRHDFETDVHASSLIF